MDALPALAYSCGHHRPVLKEMTRVQNKPNQEWVEKATHQNCCCCCRLRAHCCCILRHEVTEAAAEDEEEPTAAWVATDDPTWSDAMLVKKIVTNATMKVEEVVESVGVTNQRELSNDETQLRDLMVNCMM